ncbi:MAG: translation initiation factor IF-3 [Chloroflexi bacterium]|nr:translation initiation factor IF-3 [Chloroflexota bacterium]
MGYGEIKIQKKYRVNSNIIVSNVRVITGENSQESVVLDTGEAIKLAANSGLDLVEVGPNQTPPVCRIMDYGRFKYIQGKKDKESQKASRAASKVKEVRLSPVTSENDLKSKMKITKGLLLQGAKVRVFVRFRGRQNAHPNVGMKVLQKFAEGLSDYSKLESAPSMVGRSINIVLTPLPGLKNKITNENIETGVSV